MFFIFPNLKNQLQMERKDGKVDFEFSLTHM